MTRRFAKVFRGAALFLRSAVLGMVMRGARARRGIDGNKVVFSSFKGAAFSDSPRAIAEALHALRPGTDIVFQLRDGADAPAWVRRVKPNSLQWLREISTARAIVDNFNRPFYQKKLAGQKYIQTWHGDRGFKRILYDKDENGGFPDYQYMDLAVAGSDFGEGVYRSAFRYAGEVLKVGIPRNDALLRAPVIALAKERTGLPADKRILLYAPTFRDSRRGGMYSPEFDLRAAAKRLSGITGEDWVCVARAHEQNAGVVGAEYDASQHPDMAELLMAADLLVTDYSSCAGDFPLLGRPVILYHSGAGFERDLYFDVAESPFWVARTPEELYALFGRLSEAADNARAILEFFGTHETGAAAKAVAERICAWLDA